MQVPVPQPPHPFLSLSLYLDTLLLQNSFVKLVSTTHNTYVNPGSVAQFDFHQSDKSNTCLLLISFLSSNDLMESFRVWYLMCSVVITSIYTRISRGGQSRQDVNLTSLCVHIQRNTLLTLVSHSSGESVGLVE